MKLTLFSVLSLAAVPLHFAAGATVPPNYYDHSSPNYQLLLKQFNTTILCGDPGSGSGSTLPPGCSSIITRKNVNNLTGTEWNNFVSAFNKAYQAKELEFLPVVHYDNYYTIHGVPAFLPWHRYFIRQFEKALQKYDSTVFLPYWDSASDWQYPETSLIMQPNRLGGNGDPVFYCVNNGVQANENMDYPYPGCLSRIFSGPTQSTIYSWASPEVVALYYQNTVFSDFATALETGLHRDVHVGIGGTMRDNNSPFDLFFFFHHANMDRLWNNWQLSDPSYANAYSGVNYDNFAARLTDALANFTGATVSSVMDLYNSMCIQYDDNIMNAPAPAAYPAETAIAKVPSSVLSTYLPRLTQASATAVGRSKVLHFPPVSQSDVDNAHTVLVPPRRRTQDDIAMMHWNYTKVRALETRIRVISLL